MGEGMYTFNSTRAKYTTALAVAREQSPRIKEATSAPEEMPETASYYLSPDRKSGYGVTDTGELIGLFSLVPGRGEAMVREAIKLDAVQALDCFDGFLPKYYEKFGFREFKREPNWTEGGPDVVYMEIEQ